MRVRKLERHALRASIVALALLVALMAASIFRLEWALHTRRHRVSLTDGALVVTWRTQAIATTCPATALFEPPPTTPAAEVVQWGDPPIAAWFVPGVRARGDGYAMRVPLRPIRSSFDERTQRGEWTISLVPPTVAVLALLVVLAPRAVLNRRRRRNVCSCCGQLLSGIGLRRCPECGAAVPRSSQWACEFVFEWPRPCVRSANSD